MAFGIFLGEVAAFILALVCLYHFFFWLEFKFKVMVRKDKEDFYARHGLDIGEDTK